MRAGVSGRPSATSAVSARMRPAGRQRNCWPPSSVPGTEHRRYRPAGRAALVRQSCFFRRLARRAARWMRRRGPCRVLAQGADRAFIAETRCREFFDRSHARTRAQPRAALEFPHGRVPYILGCEFPSPTVLRVGAQIHHPPRYPTAYRASRFMSQTTPAYERAELTGRMHRSSPQTRITAHRHDHDGHDHSNTRWIALETCNDRLYDRLPSTTPLRHT